MLRSPRVWIGLAISAVFIALFLYQTDFGEIRDAFRGANYWLAFASLPVYFSGLWMRTIRWQFLLRPVKRVSTLRLYPVVIIGLMANNLIPARIGELVRAYVLGEREKVSKASSLGTIAVDRLFDGLTLVPLLVIVAAIVGTDVDFEADLYFVTFNVNFFGLAVLMGVLFGAALFVLLPLAFSDSVRGWADALINRVTPDRFLASIEGLAHSFFRGLDSLRNPLDLTLAWVMSGASWVLEATMYYIVGLAFDIHIGFEYYLLACAAANLAISILASQGGVGPFEWVVKQTFIAAGVAEGAATAYAIGVHALVLLPVIVLGLYFLSTMNLSLGEMFRRSTASLPEAEPIANPALSGKEASGP